jgi:PadR family transcriptional regulator PadR
MPKFFCPRHAGSPPCSCSMGNLYRYIEPVVLLVLKEEQKSYGYDLAEKLTNFALTDARIERASLYRTLRVLEENGHVTSTWDVEGSGPARRVYALTKKGRRHLQEWAQLLGRMGQAMIAFSERARAGGKDGATGSKQ